MDIISFIAGLVVGIVAVSIAVEFAWRKSFPEKTCKLTKNWNLNELRSPSIVAEKLEVAPPSEAKVVVATPTPHAKNARENPDAVHNFAFGLNKAYIFAGKIRDGQIAVVTGDEDIIKELKEKVKSILGPTYSDKLFHKLILEEGSLPMKFLREIVLKKAMKLKR